ncbi:SMP-30/gluconolactonase/LRE family protein [Streptomyces liangshanensis]|uniref:SMP-30/gluconolactonase/LRE family protein n=1 Tax=Streptomyces liangshanensis TaxID=2717324 RepID=UPI0036DCDE43
MSYRIALRAAVAFVLSAAALAAPVGVASATGSPAAPWPVSHPRIVKHFDAAAGQLPENQVVDPDHSVTLVFAGSHQIARVTGDGSTKVLATLPAPADGGIRTPTIGVAIATGLAEDQDGTFYVGYAAGNDNLTGVWRIRPGGTPQRVVALPADSFPNGIALDRATGQLYIADSSLGTVWRAPAAGGRPTAWATGAALARTTSFGANGLKLHNDAVWVSNLDAGTLLRIPVGQHGRAGKVETRSTGTPGIDDFAFPGRGDSVFAADFGSDRVLFIKPDGTRSVVLGAADGLDDPTSIGIADGTLYVTSAAYSTPDHPDPNLLRADLGRGY